MRLRSVKRAHEELMQQDPDCALKLAAFRKKVYGGEWPSVQIGKNRLVDLDKIIEILEGGEI